MYRLIACCIFFHVGRGHYLDIFPPGEPVLPVLHMGYMWKQYFLQFPAYRIAGFPITGKDDIPSDRRYYLLLCWEGPVFRHIPIGWTCVLPVARMGYLWGKYFL